MSKRAEEKAVEYQIKTHGPNVMGGASMLSEEEYMRFNMNLDFKNGYEQAEKDLGWHSVEESLPPVDEEVIVLTDIIAEDSIKIGLGRVCFAHIVNPELTVEVGDISYTPMSYNGWNIDGVKYWMPMPKLPEEEQKYERT